MENATTPLAAEIIALNDKKVAMALDDIIKLSKRKTSVNKGKKQRRQKNNTQNFNRAARNNTSKVQHYTSSLSAVRQGAIAKRRSNFQGHQYPVTIDFARKAATAPPRIIHGRAFNAGRMTSANQSRLIAPPVQKRSVQARVIAKRQEVVHEKVVNGGGRRKTLDSRFASMKEQRKTYQSNNNYGNEVQVPRLPPWARARRFLR